MPTSTHTPSPNELLIEDFEGETSCFEQYSDASMSSQMESGKFSLKAIERDTMVWSKCQNNTFVDFTLEVDVSIMEDNEGESYFGVMFRETGGQWYDLVIDSIDGTDSVYCLSYNDEDGYVPLTSSTFDPGNCWVEVPANILDSQENTIRVSAIGDRIEVYLNEEILVITRDNLLAAGRIGFIAGTFDQEIFEVAYDNVRVTEP